MVFQMPNTLPGQGISVEWRCAGCGVSIRGTEHELPTFCAFCKAWAQWRREDDDAWARAVSGSQDDGGGSGVHLSATGARQ
jgi:hypothetical protein